MQVKFTIAVELPLELVMVTAELEVLLMWKYSETAEAEPREHWKEVELVNAGEIPVTAAAPLTRVACPTTICPVVSPVAAHVQGVVIWPHCWTEVVLLHVMGVVPPA